MLDNLTSSMMNTEIRMLATMKKIGERIEQLRMQKGWSQAELAAKVGVTRSAINQLESGETKNPRPATLMKLADALQVDERELMGLPVDADDVDTLLLKVLREMPIDRKMEVARYTQYQAGQVTKLLANESFARYMNLLTKLIDDRNGTPKKPE